MAYTIPVIIPTIKKDYIRMRDLLVRRVFMYLPVSELVFIGNDELCRIVQKDIDGMFAGLNIRCVNEEELVARSPVISLITARVEAFDRELMPRVRCGWYYQQFLKMAYHEKCSHDHYMSWDMDTVPLRTTEIFDDRDRPVFGLKSEHNPGYFITIENLLGLKKNVEGSFISEHMVFSREYMEELFKAILSSGIKGTSFWEKVIGAVDDRYLPLGFSEFETYGTFVTDRHPEEYGYTRFKSFRRGSWFIREGELDEDDIAWLAKDYDAVTFENAEPIPEMVELFKNPKYRNSMSAEKFYETILESGYFGEYSNGRIDAGDWYAPV